MTQRQGRPPIHHGAWLDQLESALRAAPDLTLGIAALSPRSVSSYEPFVSNDVTYYELGADDSSSGLGRVAERWRRLGSPSQDLGRCERIVTEFRPDIIHVHGSENAFGLLAGRVSVPVVVSIQGILTVYEVLSRRGMDASLLLSLSPGLFLRGTGALLDRVALHHKAARERLVFQRCQHFIGRTRFDADVVRILSPHAHYHHCDELLRPEFFLSSWDQSRSNPCTVYGTAGVYGRKGLGTLLRAIALLRRGPAPTIRLRLAGMPSRESEDGRAVTREIRHLGLSACVDLRGTLGPLELVHELLGAGVFVLPTHADNSPNSLAEAMAVGTPCVASAAGGIPTLARDGVDALLVQDGDPYALAGSVQRLIDDPALALRLSQKARATALARHDSSTVRVTMLEIYRRIIDGAGMAEATGGLAVAHEE